MTPVSLFKILIASIICFGISTTSLAQSNDTNSNPYASLPFKNRLFFGGDLGFNFSSTYTYIRVAPLIGYNVNPKLSVGVSPSYEFFKDERYIPAYESTIFGGSAFARYFVIPQIFLQVSPEVLNLDELPIRQPNGDFLFTGDRVTIPILLIGGGFSQRSPNGSGFFIGGFYDVIQDINSPYPNNFVLRIGGMIGL